MAWQAKQTAKDIEAKEDAKRLFFEQRAFKQAEEEELRQTRLHNEQTKLLKIEQQRAERAVAEAAAVELELAQKAEELRQATSEIKLLKGPGSSRSPPRSSGGFMNPFAGLWGKSPTSSKRDEVRV